MLRLRVIVAASLFGCCLAGPLDVRDHSSSTPWPSIPDPSTYTGPSEGLLVYPVSTVKGVTTEQGPQANLSFSSVGDIYTLDYGKAQAGIPFFEVASLGSEYAQIEIKYTEAYNGLLVNYSDGPYPFANGLASEFRVETLNITKTGELRSYFVQGSQRWQSIKLIKGSGVELSSVGFVSTIDQAPLDSKPGYFASSNTTHTDIWNLGPRTEQFTCFPPESQKSTWEIDPVKGAYVRGQKPATTIRGANAQNYTLSFETMIDYGGVGWRLDNEVDYIWAQGPYLVLTSNYPEGSFVNYNASLVPKNTLVLGRGWSLQNQSTLTGWHLDSFPVPMDITEKEWHTIETDSPGEGVYVVRVDGQEIANFNISHYNQGAQPPYFPVSKFNSFAFGPWQDQAAWYRNVKVQTSSGLYYNNSMTSDDVPVEYGVATNNLWAMSDAGKRDRFSWLGDRVQSARSVEAVGDFACTWGPIEEVFARQISAGSVPCNTLFSQLDPLGAYGRTSEIDLILVDQQDGLFDIVYHAWMKTGDTDKLRQYWPNLSSLLGYTIQASIDPTTNFGTNGGSGPALSSTLTILTALDRMIEMATYLGYNTSISTWEVQAQLTRAAAESTWNATGGYFALPGSATFVVGDMAGIELNKVGTKEQRDTFWDKLSTRQAPAGFIDPPTGDSQFNLLDAGLAPINVNLQSHLLQGVAARRNGSGVIAQDMLERTYAPMLRGVNASGGYWEFISDDGTYPGNDLETALTHFWGGYPTAFMTEYVLGALPTKPGFEEFIVEPLTDWSASWVEGRVPTPYGLIYIAWGYGSDGKISMEVTAPKGTTGQVTPPFSGKYSLNGKSGQSGTFKVTGGSGKQIVIQD